MKKRYFYKKSATYRCIDCDKLTRDTGQGEGGTGLCAECFNQAELENAIADGNIAEEKEHEQNSD